MNNLTASDLDESYCLAPMGGIAMEKIDIKSRPSSEYRYWLYDPEGDGVMYFRNELSDRCNRRT